MEKKDTENTCRLNYNDPDNLDMFFLVDLPHPSFVYGVKFHPLRDETALYLATICFDGKVRIWHVNVQVMEFASAQCLEVKSIFDPPNFTIGTKKSVYAEDDNLEEDTLRLIMNPQDYESHHLLGPSGEVLDREDEKMRKKMKQMVQKKHPNTLAFNNRDTLFVGDSHGQINVWRISIQHGRVTVLDHYLIRQKEIEGDQINQIICHPEVEKQIYVQSRDNCIRLLDFETSHGVRVRKRFFGAKCSNQMVQCALSTDGRYLVAGSETGQPYVWADETEQLLDTREYECKFSDVVSDVHWNPRYNMFAVSGFGHEFPVLVYVYERDAKQIEELQFRFGGALNSQVEGP